MLPLLLTTQSYAWGTPAATQSKVLSLARANGVEDAQKPEPDTRFAELWVGTHPSGGATVAAANNTTAAAAAATKPQQQQQQSLDEWLADHPDALGSVLMSSLGSSGQEMSGKLPYIMKVLSIDKPLPLQAHPTQDTAAAMHEEKPELYPDCSHKPEMAICLNNFSAFVGFLAFDKLSQQLGRLPDLAAVYGDDNVQQYLAAGPGPENQARRHKALASMLSHLLLKTPPEVAAATLDSVLKHLQAQAEGSGAVLLPASTQDQQAAAAAGDTKADSSSGAGSSSNAASGPGSSSSAAAAGSSDAPSPQVPTTGTSSKEFATEAARLEGPTSGICKESNLNLALGVVTQPGALGQRAAMIAAAAAAWPDDAAGVLALLLMEDVVLQQGEACLIPAGCPHAYVSGEILEVQAASNNTIKGGLTAHGEPTDKQGLVDTVTAGILGPTRASGTSSDQDSTSGTSGDQRPSSGTLGDQPPGVLYEGPPEMINPIIPSGSSGSSQGSNAIKGLQLYQPAVLEFQVWHGVITSESKGLDYVMDPGPGVLLVTGGTGTGIVKAGVVVSPALVDEVELHPGTAFFIPAGSSIRFTGSSSTEALDFWMTTANSRFFAAAAAAAPAGAALTPSGPEMRQNITAAAEGGESNVTVRDVTGQGAGSDAVAGGGLTAAEQVAAALMAGAAGSSCPANAQDAAAATAADGAAKLTLQSSGPAPMDTD